MTDPIPLTCPKCERSFKVKAAAAGKTVRCPACKDPVPVPEAAPAGVDAELAELGLEPERPRPKPIAGAFDGAGDRMGDPQALEQPAAGTPPAVPSRAAYQAPQAQHQASSLPAARRYLVLSVLQYVYGVVGGLTILAGLGIGALGMLGGAGGLMVALMPAVGAVIGGLFLIGAAQVIELAMDVQTNTLASARANEYAANQAWRMAQRAGGNGAG